MKRGFTLAEMLVVIVIVAAGIAALLVAFSAALGVSRNVEETELAALIAGAKMEELKACSYGSIANATSDSGSLFTGLTGYTVAVNSTKPADPAILTIAVSWPSKGGTASVTLTTLRAKI
jgi:prepilin-type N-terminal cleavage/methylation domain-containing protein